jgi:hypothetical protein
VVAPVALVLWGDDVSNRSARKLRLPTLLTAAVSVTLAAFGTVLADPVMAATAVGYTVVGPTQKVLKTASVTGSPRARLAGARNEYVSFQVVLPGGVSGQSGMSVRLGSALTGRSGTIPNSKMTIYREDYYTTTEPSSAGRAVGDWPDALIPTVDRLYGQARKAFPVNVPAGETRVAFVDLLIPQDQAPGAYDGSVVVTNDHGRSASVPVHLDVRDFTLPSTSSLRSSWGVDWDLLCDYLYGDGCNESSSAADQQRAWRTNSDFVRLALDDRMTVPTMAPLPPADSAQIANFDKYMLPLINGTAPTQLPAAKLTAVGVDRNHVGEWKTLAERDGFTDRALMYDAHDCDEPGTKSAKWANCINVVNGFKSAWPGLPNLMTSSIDNVNAFDPSYAITDIVVPVVDQMDGLPATPQYAGNQRPKYDAILSHPGKELWMYTSCDVSGCDGPGETDPYFQHPWMDYTLDTQASQNRSMGWLDYVYGATGELYYNTTQQLPTAWTDQVGFGGIGDGTLFYPGTTDRIGGSTPIPLESLRMKMVRDGYQDYEYLKLATKAGHGAEAMSIAKGVYASTHDAGPSGAAVEQARTRLAGLVARRPGRH